MSDPCHIVWGDSGLGCLKQSFELAQCQDPIIAFREDFRIGPLMDADQADAPIRDQWWADVWQQSMAMDMEGTLEAYIQSIRSNRQQLFLALEQRESLVVWIGNNVHDQLMLSMIAAQLSDQAELAVVDVTNKVRYHHEGSFALSLCNPEELSRCASQIISQEKREQLGRQWVQWKKAAQAWREMDSQGNMVEFPFDHLDNLLLTALARLQPCPMLKVVGEVMGKYRSLVPDNVLFWRMRLLGKQGRIKIGDVPGTRPVAAIVSLVR